MIVNGQLASFASSPHSAAPLLTRVPDLHPVLRAPLETAQVKLPPLPPPYPPVDMHAIYARDLDSDVEYVAVLNPSFPLNQFSSLRGAHEGTLLVESAIGDVAVFEVEGASLISKTVVAGGGFSRSPVIGEGPLGITTVVYQDQLPNLDWTLNSWIWDESLETPAGRVVATVDAEADKPDPSVLDETVYFNGGSPSTVLAWYPAADEIEPGHDPIPYPIYQTSLEPDIHACGTLHDFKLGDPVSLLRGENCGPGSDEDRLYAVTTRDGWVVTDGETYQPFRLDLTGTVGRYDVIDDIGNAWIAFEDGGDIEVMSPDRWWLQRTRPGYNLGRVLSPWNLRATGEGTVVYAEAPYHDWTLNLAGGFIYRVFVTSGDSCVNWDHEAQFELTGQDFSVFVPSNLTGDPSLPLGCPAIDVGPFLEDTWLNLRVDRYYAGAPGFEPPLIYQLSVTPL